MVLHTSSTSSCFGGSTCFSHSATKLILLLLYLEQKFERGGRVLSKLQGPSRNLKLLTYCYSKKTGRKRLFASSLSKAATEAERTLDKAKFLKSFGFSKGRTLKMVKIEKTIPCLDNERDLLSVLEFFICKLAS